MIKLNLGCGKDYLNGYINVDMYPGDRVDVLHNLNIIPYPFKKNSVQHIIMNDILEHLENPDLVIQECYRILTVGGTLEIKVPHFSNSGAYYYDHRHYFNIASKSMFFNSTTNMNRPIRFEILENRILFHSDKDCRLRVFWRIYDIIPKLVCKINPIIWEICFLKNIFPAVNIFWKVKKTE